MRLQTNRIVPVIISAALILLSTGCVGFKFKRRPATWPGPISASNLKQFEGVFSNSAPRVTRERSDDLYSFLIGQGHSHGKRGTQVEIRSSADQKTLHVRLLDEQRLEVASVSLQRGVNFDFSRGFLNLHGPFTGGDAKAGNIAAYVGYESAGLYLTTTHDLLGRRSGRGAGLLFYFIPFLGGSRYWVLWPQATHEQVPAVHGVSQ